jgi:hypothetical protein
MTAGATPLPSFEFLAEPTLVVQRDGTIVSANGPARRLFAEDPVGSDLFGRVFHAPEEVEALLRRASGSSSPTIGGARLNTAAGPGGSGCTPHASPRARTGLSWFSGSSPAMPTSSRS